MSQVSDAPPIDVASAIARAGSLLARTPKPSRAIRLVLPVSLRTSVFYETLLRTEDFPQIAWHAGIDGSRAVGTGDSELSPHKDSAPLLHLAGTGHVLPSCLPWAWLAEPFDAEAEARPRCPWGSLRTGLCFVPRVLLWRGEEQDWLIYTRAALATETAPAAAARLVQEALGVWRKVTNTKPCAPTPRGRLTIAETQLGARDDFPGRVVALKQELAAQNMAKVVLARQMVQAAPERKQWDAVSTFQKMLSENPTATSFFFRRGPLEAFLGATPETLCQVDKDRVTTHAIAGTAPRGRDAGADAGLGQMLLDSAKDRHEHQLVVAHLRTKLLTVTRPSALQIEGTPSLLLLPHVQHLMTAFTGRLLPGVSALQVAQMLHPTPAVCGVPVKQARAYLRTHEPFSRGLYAGFAGWHTAGGQGAFVVTIRSLLITPPNAFLFAGAGIVPDSSPEMEEQETLLKARGAAGALVAVSRPQP